MKVIITDVGVENTAVDSTYGFIFFPVFFCGQVLRDRDILFSMIGHQNISVRLQGIFEEPMNDNHIDAGQFRKPVQPIKQCTAAVDDDFKIKSIDMGTDGTRTRVRFLQLMELVGKLLEKKEQSLTDLPPGLLPLCRVTVLYGEEKHRIAFQLGNLKRDFHLFDDGSCQLVYDDLGVAKFRLVGHKEFCIPADIRDHQNDITFRLIHHDTLPGFSPCVFQRRMRCWIMLSRRWPFPFRHTRYGARRPKYPPDRRRSGRYPGIRVSQYPRNPSTPSGPRSSPLSPGDENSVWRVLHRYASPWK